MKYVKCVNPLAINLTYQKVYEVISFFTSDFSKLTYYVIINDLGVESTYMDEFDHDRILFEDVTAEVRDNKINDILND